MNTYKFHVLTSVYEIESPTVGEAMQWMNRNVIDGLNLHPMAWMDMSQPNEYYCAPGNYFD